MKFQNPSADVFIPDGKPAADALARVTHLGIGAHQDDLEFMAFHGILTCFGQEDKWFGGVTCTSGAGSSRTGRYAALNNTEMATIRRQEQNKAAVLGRFGTMIQLDYDSDAVKRPSSLDLKNDLKAILSATQPEVVYTHNPADKHDTHIGIVVAALQAMRELPREQRPKQVIGCEVWRDLDWLLDSEKVVMDVSGHDDLAAELNGVFASQIGGGKRYDLATLGRRAANATFFNSHATDHSTQVIFGMDLTPIVADESKDILDFVCAHIERFHADVRQKLAERLGRA
jgi:LmbE family N-acetylglucosaminyl deacetylase